MLITYEEVAESALDAERQQRFLKALDERLADPGHFELVVAGNFAEAVRRRASDQRERDEYQADRLFGQAVAKTFVRNDGRSVCLIVDANTLRSGQGFDRHDVRRLAAHEAYHAAIHQRLESVADLRQRRKVAGYSRLGYFLECGGILVEEYRVERALAEEGLALDEGYRSDLPQSLRRLQERILDGVTLRHPTESIERCAKTVMEAFHRFAVLSTYLAAHDALAGAPELSTGLALRLIGPHYDRLAETLRRCPSAARPTRRLDVESCVDRLVAPLDEWLQFIGFGVEDRQGGLYFDVLRHDWMEFASITA